MIFLRINLVNWVAASKITLHIGGNSFGKKEKRQRQETLRCGLLLLHVCKVSAPPV
jgi:hypothetical protein